MFGFGDDSSDDEGGAKEEEAQGQRKALEIDSVLEELRNRDARRRAQPPSAPAPSGRSNNVFVGHIHPDVDETMLLRDFGEIGDVASVKIVWPRTQEERARGHNNGFVAFMTPEGAERALHRMASKRYFGMHVRLDWGKAVPVPPVPLYAAPASQQTPEATADQPPPPPPPLPLPPSEADVKTVVTPPDPEVAFRCDLLAHYVALHGLSFEEAVRKQERNNELFAFIDDPASPDHAYYRWRIYAYCQGDDGRTWRTEAFRMINGDALWVPPPLPTTAPRPAAIEPPRRVGRALTEAEAEELRAALGSLSLQRLSVRRAMAACLDASEASEAVVDMLCEPFDDQADGKWARTPPVDLIARFYVINDVLYNTGPAVEAGLARGASAYRSLIQDRLGAAMRTFKAALQTVGRLSAEEMRGKVLVCLRAWATRGIFSEDFLKELRKSLM